MANDPNAIVPVWTLATSDVNVPAIAGTDRMTPQRLNDLRTALAALAETPIVTLEVHPLPADLDRNRGVALDSASPLAQHLSRLITETSGSAPTAQIGAGADALYRMVVPAKAAEQLSGGLVKPMASKAASGGVYSALLNSSGGNAGQSTFVPVAEKAATALTAAAPLVLLAVAAGVLIERMDRQFNDIAEAVEKLRQVLLEAELSRLDSCRTAITKATAVLLDRGRIGESLGLGPAVKDVDDAIAAANRRLRQWQQTLAGFPEGKVQLAKVRTAFENMGLPAGEFRAHLEMSRLAIDLKRRVLVLQAVEHGQMEQDNPFERFMGALQDDQRSLEKLASGIDAVLHQLSTIRLDRTHGVRDVMFSSGAVDELLFASQQLRDLAECIEIAEPQRDVAIEMARSADGSLVVFPALDA